jgi:hypothetical protein
MRTSYLLLFGRQVTSITRPKLAAACQHKTRKRLQSLSCELQGAVQRLKQGAELLSRRLDQDDQYYSAAAELQKHWKLKVSAAAIGTQESCLICTSPHRVDLMLHMPVACLEGETLAGNGRPAMLV